MEVFFRLKEDKPHRSQKCGNKYPQNVNLWINLKTQTLKISISRKACNTYRSKHFASNNIKVSKITVVKMF